MPRRGTTFIEYVVAMVVLGVAMMGMFPIMIVQSRSLESLELRYTETGHQVNLDAGKSWFAPVSRYDLDEPILSAERENYGVWYFEPSQNDWAKKIGAAATLTRTAPSDPPEPELIVDDDNDSVNVNDDYVEEAGAGWEISDPDNGYYADTRQHPLAPADPKPKAAWTISGLTPGRYDVYATWPMLTGVPATADTAKFSVITVEDEVEGLPVAEVPVNQYNLPSDDDPNDAGRAWQLLTATPRMVGSSDLGVRVRIEALTNAYGVAADAIMLVPVDNEVKVQSVVRSITADETTARVKVEANPP